MSTPAPAARRDERIDFIRGIVMTILVVVHIEIVSLFTFFAWERFGLVSGGEGFVILSGVVVGMVSHRRLEKGGWSEAVWRLVDRAAQLYRVNVAVILLILLVALVPFVDVKEVTTFTDRFARQTFPLFPTAADGFYGFPGRILLLRAGPHQLQILGLYVVLMAATPLALVLLHHGRTSVLLGSSVVLFFLGHVAPRNLTGANFENAFPLLNWQILYVLGLAIGHHRDALEARFSGSRARVLVLVAGLVALACFVLAQATPNPVFPPWTRLHLIAPETYDHLHKLLFDKNSMGLGRVVNDFALLLVIYALLTRFWNAASRALGWFFVPLGQASLYVFLVHVFVVLLVAQFRPFGFEYTRSDFLLNTLVHAGALLLLWALVRRRFLYRWIPR